MLAWDSPSGCCERSGAALSANERGQKPAHVLLELTSASTDLHSSSQTLLVFFEVFARLCRHTQGYHFVVQPTQPAVANRRSRHILGLAS